MDVRLRHLTPAERRRCAEALAAARRAQALLLRRSGFRFHEIGVALGVSLERARRITYDAERRTSQPRWYAELPQRAISRLSKLGLLQRPELEAAHALARLSARELLRTPNFGRTSLAALCAWLAGHGLELRPESAHAFATRRRREASPENDEGAPMRERPSDSETGPLPTDRNEDGTPCQYTTIKS
jgi:hypothetical protein